MVVHYLAELMIKLTSKKTVMDVSVMICAADCKCGECSFPMLRCYTNVIQINNYVYLANSLAKQFSQNSTHFLTVFWRSPAFDCLVCTPDPWSMLFSSVPAHHNSHFITLLNCITVYLPVGCVDMTLQGKFQYRKWNTVPVTGTWSTGGTLYQIHQKMWMDVRIFCIGRHCTHLGYSHGDLADAHCEWYSQWNTPLLYSATRHVLPKNVCKRIYWTEWRINVNFFLFFCASNFLYTDIIFCGSGSL